MSETVACTVIARNYLAFARVLTQSFLQHHPNGRVIVLVLDDEAGTVAENELFEVVHPRQVMDETVFLEMAVMYDVLELATAVKPWLLRWLSDRHDSPVVYLDPDIRIYDSLHEAFELAQRHDLVLTPHTTAPVPRDGLAPDEEYVLKSGVYNLGFLAVSPWAKSFFDWWEERLRTDCIVAPQMHIFVDQRWMDLAPGYFDAALLKDAGYNVAYWNLGVRRLERANARFLVEGQPLRFFHFSGFDPDTPATLSRHGLRPSRAEIKGNGALRELCRSYADELLAAGHREARRDSYGWSSLPNGLVLDIRTRRLFRAAVLRHRRGEGPPPPARDMDAKSFLSRLAEEAPPSELGWRYVARWSPAFPPEMEHLLMAISRRDIPRTLTSKMSVLAWRMGRRRFGRQQ